ncbi:TlpA disulfide reductase family protein [Telluribacter sp. SYSU D00476]|uniref:TlpA family protein disulfide reductase n=1 Tax=Telluribacter sp. SYSU D00476 TaxID=2811430 RepID=UPI001FF46EFA|nr:TlpA disulfide reductase family protein [Telluribacter sp. SYSU D00476]
MLALAGPDIKKLKEESSYEATSFLKELPINASYVKANLDAYRRVIDFEISNNLTGLIYYTLEKDGKTTNKDTLLVLIDKAIRSNARLAPIREFLLAKNTHLSLTDYGLRPSVIQQFTQFTEEYPNSPYTPTLEAIFDKYYEVGEGKEAKDFTAIDPNGKEIRLSDLKGKVVYVDTWATWCAPCLAEFPHSKKMVEHYRGNDKVVFLFVSTDTDTQKWKSFVNSNKVPKGMHVNYNPEKQKPSLHELYRMRGIPHYILVDKAGKIKVNRAPRPSEKESYVLIDDLLDQ